MTIDRYLIAGALAARAHAGHYDLGGEPYIGHPLRVADRVPDFAKVVAVLHDVIEDAPEFEDEVRALLTDDEALAINLLTKTDEDKADYAGYIDRLIKSGNEIAIEVKLADLTDNMDVTRLTKITDGAVRRLKKYHAAYTDLKYARDLLRVV